MESSLELQAVGPCVARRRCYLLSRGRCGSDFRTCPTAFKVGPKWITIHLTIRLRNTALLALFYSPIFELTVVPRFIDSITPIPLSWVIPCGPRPFSLSQFGGLRVLLVFGQYLGQHRLGKHSLLFCVPISLRQQCPVIGGLGEGECRGCVVDTVGGGGPERPGGESEAEGGGIEGCLLHLAFVFLVVKLIDRLALYIGPAGLRDLLSPRRRSVERFLFMRRSDEANPS